MKHVSLVILTFAFATCQARVFISGNEIVQETPRIKSGDELLTAIISDCFTADSATECLKVKVLTYLDNLLGFSSENARAFTSDNIDKVIFERVSRILNTHEFRVTLPEFIFQKAELTYRADRGLDVDVPEGDEETSEARGLLKKKLLLPVLLLLKLKMKALMPIFVALIGIKALKALVLSKIAIVLVVGFLVVQLMKKGGMPMMMNMAPAPEPTPPSSAYGPAAAASSVATPSDSYSPQWEPSNNGPYSRVWDTAAAHNLAYSAYYPGSSSSSSSYSSPSSPSSSYSTLSSSSTSNSSS